MRERVWGWVWARIGALITAGLGEPDFDGSEKPAWEDH